MVFLKVRDLILRLSMWLKKCVLCWPPLWFCQPPLIAFLYNRHFVTCLILCDQLKILNKYFPVYFTGLVLFSESLSRITNFLCSCLFYWCSSHLCFTGQRDTTGLSAENAELKIRLQAMEQQAQLRDGEYLTFSYFCTICLRGRVSHCSSLTPH